MLILSIVLAAMAPVMTTRNKSDYSSPWRYSTNGSDAYFAGNAVSNQIAMLGQHEVGTGENDARLIIRTAADSGWSHLLFKTGDEIVGRLYLDESNLYLSNTSSGGSESTSVGIDALSNNTGENNTAVGNYALHSNTSGIMNTGIGSFALKNTSSGENNTVVGFNALAKNTTGSGNVAVGSNSLQYNKTGNDNIAIGTNANYGNFYSQPVKTIAMGNQTSAYGNGSIALGSSLISSEGDGTSYTGAYSSGSRSIAIGNGSSSKESDSIALGTGALTGSENSFIHGTSALALGLSTQALGPNAIAIGSNAKAGETNISGSSVEYGSIAIGALSHAPGPNSIAIGRSAESNYEGIAIGNDANADYSYTISLGNKSNAINNYSISIGEGSNASGFPSLAIGGYANASGDYSIAIGGGILNSTSFAPDASGTGAISIGNGSNAVGDNTTAIGYNACRYVTGSNKICIGANSGPASGSDWASSSDNNERIFIGGKSKFNNGTAVLEVHNLSSNSLTNLGSADNDTSVVINGNLIVMGNTFLRTRGQNQQHDNNSIRFHLIEHEPDGNKLLTTSYQFQQAWPDLWNSLHLSDRRLKYVGKENTSGLDKIRQLKVFNYTFKKDEKKTPHVGVIAQDLQKVFPDAVKKGVDGFLTIRMEDMFYAVINAIKELDAKYQAQEKRINELEQRIERLESKLN